MRRRLALLAAMWGLLAAVGPSGLERAPSLCLHRAVHGEDCRGCGLTRSVAQLARLDAAGAHRRHPLGIPIAGALVWLLLRPGLRRPRPR